MSLLKWWELTSEHWFSASTEKVPEMSNTSGQTELLRKETSVPVVGCNEYPEHSGGKVSTHKRCAQVNDLRTPVVR